MESARTRAKINKGVMYVILILMAFIMLVPFAWMILTAVKTNQEAISVNPFYIFPQSGWHWENFAKVWKSYNFIILYKNTLLMIFFRVVCACLTATMAGYAFGRLNFPGKNVMFSLVLIQMMIPSQIFIIPQYLMVSKMGMLNTTFGLVFPGIVTAFAVENVAGSTTLQGEAIGAGASPDSSSPSTTVTIGAGFTVKAGDAAASATVVTDFATNRAYKYAQILSPVSY